MKARHRHIILIILLAFVLTARFSVEIGEWYSIVIYPVVSGFLSYAASWIPFSLEEIVVVGAVLLLVFIIVNGIRKKIGFVKVLFQACEFLLWIYVWFYIGWGCNYYRESIYTRLEVERQAYDESVFKDFITDYADSLNSTYEALPNDLFYVGYDYFENHVKYAFLLSLRRPDFQLHGNGNIRNVCCSMDCTRRSELWDLSGRSSVRPS